MLDRSSSIADEWSWVTSELSSFMAQEESFVRFGLRQFPADGAGCSVESIMSIKIDNATTIEDGFTAPTVDGQTPIVAALSETIPAFGDPNQGQYIILITDGDETCAADDLPLLVQGLARGGVETFAIGIGNGANPVTIDAIATAGRTGPTGYKVANSVAFASALQAISLRTRHCGTGICYDVPGECMWPPPRECTSATQRRIYEAVGGCVGGSCQYDGVDTTCAATCTGGVCDAVWRSVSATDAPSARWQHSAVWTGTEMIIWGGGSNTGGRYAPASDSWVATTTTGAPSQRSNHTAIWTGTEMIVWGGSFTNTGGRYDPVSDEWTPTSTTDAPSLRTEHTAVWTGTEMLVWGGYNGTSMLSDGGRYNPATDTWSALVVPPLAGRQHHTAIWTGTTMIIWGGGGGGTTYYANGAQFDPIANSWTATASLDAPLSRRQHSAVWTGEEMLVWGGFGGTGTEIITGGRYDPSANSWTEMSSTDAIPARSHVSVWIGSEMLSWGGIPSNTSNTPQNSGGRYAPAADTWSSAGGAGVPSARVLHSVVWTENEMIVWGGYGSGGSLLGDGGRYVP